MNRISPPTGVQARPVATPGREVRRRDSAWKRGVPSSSRTRGSETLTLRVAIALGDPQRDLAHDGADLPLELAHAGLARVAGDDRFQTARR